MHRAATTTLALFAALVLAPPAGAESVFHCREAGGPPVFSDLPCTDAQPVEATRLGIDLHNFVDGMALDEADRRHLEAIEARKPSRAHVGGLPDPERVARCEALRREMEALRDAARQGHDGSLLGERRRLRSAIRDACH